MEPNSPPAGVRDDRDFDLLADAAAFLSEIVETQSDVAAVELDLQTIMQVVAERTQRLTGARAPRPAQRPAQPRHVRGPPCSMRWPSPAAPATGSG